MQKLRHRFQSNLGQEYGTITFDHLSNSTPGSELNDNEKANEAIDFVPNIKVTTSR